MKNPQPAAMRIEWATLLLFWFCNCGQPIQPAVPPPPALQDRAPVFPCNNPDWASDDTLFRSKAPVFFFENLSGASMGFSQKIKLADGYLGIVAHNMTDDEAIALYQTNAAGTWNMMYCGPLYPASNYKTSMPDLNFDGYDDILVDADDGGIHGNHVFMGFLYEPQDNTFRRDTALDLENLSIDVRSRQLRSRHYGSRYGACIKSLYGWEGDLLILLEEAVYHADVDAIIRLKKRQADGTVTQDSIKGKMKPLWDFFVGKCVWEGDF